MNFTFRLKELGVNVLGLADCPWEQLPLKLQSAMSDYYKVDDLHNYDQLVRGLGWFTHRYGKIDRLDSHAEYWLESEARLRSDFNIPGLKSDVITKMKSKAQMKEIFRKAKVPVAAGQVVATMAEAFAFVAEVGYPVVAKPDIGVGAAGTFKVESDDQLRSVFEGRPPGNYFLEEFISGDLYSFDGLVDRDGKLVFFTSHRFSQGIMEVVNRDDHIYYYSLRDIPADLEAAGRSLLKAFDLRERFFHFEFFRTFSDGKIVALEVTMRPPGGLTTDMFNYANNIDIYREWANVVVNNTFEAKYSRPYHALYVGRKSCKNYLHSAEEIKALYHDKLCLHDNVLSVFSAAIGNYAFLLRSPDLGEMQEAADFILALKD